ncbi:MAG: hypothetical protein IFNCLDLE_00308 [Ignavibacteriaceae bacterium]|mgnify:CR=1 FL=1|nr:hypothetical protein [Ignavibacteriaceae bacterium]
MSKDLKYFVSGCAEKLTRLRVVTKKNEQLFGTVGVFGVFCE